MDRKTNTLAKNEKKTIIKVSNLSVRFNIVSEKIDNLKEYFIKILKRELMFKEFMALKNISFEVKEGEAWGLIGTNGSGKSTLLKLISGILKPYKGNVSISGTLAPLIELGAGFDSELTARENIFLNGAVLGYDHKFMEEHFDEIVEFAELHDFLDMPIKNYSSGMAARLGFAIATMVKADILICDEVLSVGDYAFQQKCEERIHKLLEDGTTLLYVSHDVNSVKRLCNHAIWLDKGEEVMKGNALTVCDAYIKEQQGEIQAAKSGDDFDYVIIQTEDSESCFLYNGNQPVELLSKRNLPLIFYMVRRYPQKKFVIVGNKNLDIIDRYMTAFGGVQFITVNSNASDSIGNIRTALQYIPKDKRFVITKYNIILDYQIKLEDTCKNTIALTNNYEYDWAFTNLKLQKGKFKKNAVPGLFIFEDKSVLNDIPDKGDFLEYISGKKIDFEVLDLGDTKIIRSMEDLETEEPQDISDYPGRSFNIIKVRKNILTKLPQDDLGRLLAAQETEWYKKVVDLNYSHIPVIYDYNPLSMKRIDGEAVSQTVLSEAEKKQTLRKIVSALKELHSLQDKETNMYSLKDVYFNSTFSSLEAIKNIVPFAYQDTVIINKKACKNPFSIKQKLFGVIQKKLMESCEGFNLIHGDCIFSNIILDLNGNITFIDPQGCFGATKYFGDEYYDWAKLYMSVVGDWDNFNKEAFTLNIKSDSVEISVETAGWKDLEEFYFELIGKRDKSKIKLLHALIWLSATMYKWNDYKSVCGAFYLGTFYLNQILEE